MTQANLCRGISPARLDLSIQTVETAIEGIRIYFDASWLQDAGVQRRAILHLIVSFKNSERL